MKNFTLLSLLSINFTIFGQPILNQIDYNPNSSIDNYAGNPTGFSFGTAGANQTWNYATLALTLLGTSTNSTVAVAPFSGNFPLANLYVKIAANGGNDTFAFYNSSSTKLELLGYSNNSTVLVNFSPNPQTIYNFPFTYNLVVNDTYSTTLDPTANNPFTVTYDSYGTLILPFGTFNNVIRSKKLDGINPEYTWFTQNPYKIIMTAGVVSFGALAVRVFNSNNLSLNQNQPTQKLEIYPNPTNGNLTIKNIDFSNNNNFINVYDVFGNQIIKNQKINSDSENINLSNVASGLYLLKINDFNGQVLTSDKIIKD